MKNCIILDDDIFPNHWFLGGLLHVPDPNKVGIQRPGEMASMKKMRTRHPNNPVFYCMLGRDSLAPFYDDIFR